MKKQANGKAGALLTIYSEFDPVLCHVVPLYVVVDGPAGDDVVVVGRPRLVHDQRLAVVGVGGVVENLTYRDRVLLKDFDIFSYSL